MPRLSRTKIKFLDHVGSKVYSRESVGCLILSKNGKIILQQRDNNSPTFPNCLATFGGGIEAGETPMLALIRELSEELGAVVKSEEVVTLGALTEEETNHNQLVYVFFWHDKHGTITGCYEGEARYYDDPTDAEHHPKIMNDVRWLIHVCKKRKLI